MKILKWLNKHLEEYFLVSILSSIVLVMLYQVVRRYIFNSSLTWSEEFCRYAFIWFIFLALPYTILLGSELRMDAILNFFPQAVKKQLLLVITALSFLFCLFLFKQSFQTVWEAALTREISPGLHLPKQYVYLAGVVGFGLACFRYLQVLYSMLKRKEADKL